MKHESFSNFFFSFRHSRPSYWLRGRCMVAEVGALERQWGSGHPPSGPVRRTSAQRNSQASVTDLQG